MIRFIAGCALAVTVLALSVMHDGTLAAQIPTAVAWAAQHGVPDWASGWAPQLSLVLAIGLLSWLSGRLGWLLPIALALLIAADSRYGLGL